MPCALHVHDTSNSRNFQQSQDLRFGRDNLRAKIDALLQDAEMQTQSEIDQIAGYRQRTPEWSGRRLRAIREALEWSQARFADEFGASRGAVSSWEAGDNFPSIPTIWMIQDFFDEPVAKFIMNGDLRKVNEEWRDKFVAKLLSPDPAGPGRPRKAKGQ